jgi:hypothetical protein
MTTLLSKEANFGAEKNGGTAGASKKEKSFRLQLVLPETSFERLESLKQATEASSYAEVIRRSLRVLEGLIAEANAGSTVVVRKADGEEEVISVKFIA